MLCCSGCSAVARQLLLAGNPARQLARAALNYCVEQLQSISLHQVCWKCASAGCCIATVDCVGQARGQSFAAYLTYIWVCRGYVCRADGAEQGSCLKKGL
jgi:hypothetical protein